MPPVSPMLAKSVAEIPPGMQYEAKWDGFRAIVFRDGDEVELGSRTGKPLTRYFPELVEAGPRELPRSAAWSTARSSSPGDGRPRLRGAAGSASTPPPPGSGLLAEQTPASLRRLRPARARRRGPRRRVPLADRRAALTEAAGRRRPPVHLTPGHHRPRARPHLVRRGSRAPGSTASSPSPSTCPTGRASGPCSRSSTSAPPTASSPASAGTRAARWSARCCSASTTTTAGSSTSGSAPRSRWSAPPRTRRRAAARCGWTLRRPPLGRLGRRERPGLARLPGAQSRWTGKKDLSWVAAAPGAGLRGGVRPHGGRPLPAHHAVPALAPRPHP